MISQEVNPQKGDRVLPFQCMIHMAGWNLLTTRDNNLGKMQKD